MEVNLKSGTYILAVSGGVDSVVLLKLVLKLYKNNSNYNFIVAHYDHGIRPNSAEDRLFVEQLSKKYRIKFLYKNGNLGPEASEDTARKFRYEFLYEQVKKYKANALITAHHQDDLLETVILNMLRGTGRRGLHSLKNSGTLLRPLLIYAKSDIINYAVQNELKWIEDYSNHDIKYLRNKIRITVMPLLNSKHGARDYLLALIDNAQKLDLEIDNLLFELSVNVILNNKINKDIFNKLPHIVKAEYIMYWLRNNQLYYDKKTIDRILIGAKELQPQKLIEVTQGKKILVTKNYLEIYRFAEQQIGQV